MRSWVRAPSLRPRRNKLRIACSDFCKAERTRAAVPPSSNRKRFAGLQFDVRRGHAILTSFLFPAPQRVVCGNTAPSPRGLRHQTLTLRFAGSNPAGAATRGRCPWHCLLLFVYPGAAAGHLRPYAGLAQLAERLFRTQQAIRSIRISSSSGPGHPRLDMLALTYRGGWPTPR